MRIGEGGWLGWIGDCSWGNGREWVYCNLYSKVTEKQVVSPWLLGKVRALTMRNSGGKAVISTALHRYAKASSSSSSSTTAPHPALQESPPSDTIALLLLPHAIYSWVGYSI